MTKGNRALITLCFISLCMILVLITINHRLYQQVAKDRAAIENYLWFCQARPPTPDKKVDWL